MSAAPACALYRGVVRHRRHAPRRHAFRAGLDLLYLDLAELPQAFRGAWLWSVERWNLFRFRRADYHGDPARPLDEAVRDTVERETGARPAGPVRLLTTVRSLGLAFNPVSFYYCFDAAGERVEAVLAEITNTPWGERHSYVIPAAADAAPGAPLRRRFAKAFHVSPFHPMEQEYAWAFTPPGERLAVTMRNLEGPRRVFDATLLLRREELSPRSLRRALLRRPWTPLLVLLLIHFHALLLWLKRVPFHTHPAKRAAPAS